MDLDKLLEKSEGCIYDEPPACTSCCPVHMDIISFVSEMEKGEFDKAYKIMEKRVPFARIIGSICDHPCEEVCVRSDLGGAVKISELEKAAVSYGFSPPKKTIPIPKKKGRVAVIGGGISGMTAAFDLDKKGYEVTMYDKSNRLGGKLRSYVGRGLKKEVLEEELQALVKLGINVVLNTPVDKKRLEQLTGEYDAVYLGTGVWEEELPIHPQTFQVEDTSVFAGGKLANRNGSVILSASSGKRAATSIDRYIKRISMYASREREGSFETPLRYETDGIKPVRAVKKTSDIYNEDEAAREAGRCLKCRCRKCIEACSHLSGFDISPKSYMRQINQSERIILGTHYANKMINSCTMCGLCEEECFKGISMKDVIQETRESMVERGKMPVSAHDFALKDMKFSNSKRFSMVRKQPEGIKGPCQFTEKTEYLFYPGCQLPASYPEYIEGIYKYLVSNMKGGVGIYLGCCGAPADWAGRQDLMQESVEKIKKTWEDMGRPVFILACSSCCGIFEKYLPEITFVSLWKVFAQNGLPQNKKTSGNYVLSVHDACATRHNKEIHDSIRKIAALSGYTIQELKYSREKTKCCGYGGLVYYANSEQSEDFVKHRIEESDNDLLVYCAMCKDLLVDGGKRTFHILDLIFGDDLEGIALRKMPTLSDRHRNRAQLKVRLLREIWGEQPDMGLEKQSDYKITIPENVIRLMEDRYILMEDIEKVIDNAQKRSKRFFNPSEASYLARLRIDNVTYWVKYEEKGEGILVKSVYSHRMEIVEE
ncbi:MAG: pyridine nucleotide-disulfide oxidoreductase/dicluster-binding protein [Clostridia bacterium]|jgi:glutamate synthase (NADPH/NADH) small chain|nr:NAD(P)-binding protein [Clostridiales bacterium]